MKIHRGIRRGNVLWAEQGSAYIVALLLLLLLTVIGLSLSLVTQNELQIGANEKMINRVFYAADAGMMEATARALILGEFQAGSSFTPDDGSPASLGIKIQRNSYTRLNSPYCALCEVNQQPGEEPYRAITYFVDITASRKGTTSDGTDVPLAEKRLNAMLDIQPFKPQLPVVPAP
ncbi:MAG: PilX N-terminal domain-containing pilus assembly protein [Acidobacteriota bacterium]